MLKLLWSAHDLGPLPAAGQRWRHAARIGGGDSKRTVFYCAFCERSAVTVQAAHEAGLEIRLSHRGRHRRLEAGQRTAGALKTTV